MDLEVAAVDRMRELERADRRLELWVLGRFRVERDGGPVPDSAWARPTARALVKLLAIQPDHRLHQDQVIDLLWPDLSPDAALRSLRKASTFARQALEPDRRRGESSFLHVAGSLLVLDGETVWIDADDFEQRAGAALQGEDEALYRDALSRYAGELLPGDRYEEWTLERRDHLHGLYQQLLLRLAELLERRQELCEAIDCLQQVLRSDEAREDVHRRLMRLHVVSGDRHLALRQYLRCERYLRDELDVAPEPETAALYEEIASGRYSSAPPALPSRPSPSLPAAARRAHGSHFVGRELPMRLLKTELAQLTSGGEGDRDGRRGVVLIGGEAGVGKTRLAAETALAAHAQGIAVLWGSSHEEEGLSPYAPFVEALEGYVAGRTVVERRAIAASYPELGRLLPSLSREVTEGPGERWSGDAAEGGQLRLFADVVRLLADLAQAQPVLLVLDDLHAADSASLRLLHHFARAAPENRWLVLATYREEEVVAGAPLETLRSSLTRAALCRHVDLLQLSRADSAALIAALLPGGAPHPDLVERLHALSLGNALFLQELVESIKEQEIELQDGVWQARITDFAVPPRVRDVIAVRMGRLPAQVQDVLAWAAVGGMENDYPVLRRASNMEDRDLLDACDAALEARILEEQGSRLAFRHPLFRRAIYDRLSRHRRRHLHSALAGAYAALWTEHSSEEPVETIAYHFRQADAPEAAHWEERAGDRAARVHAAETATEYYEDARRRLREVDRAGAARLSEKLGRVLCGIGRYDEALTALEEAAAALQEAGDLERMGRIVAHIGLAHRWRGTPEEGVARVRPTIERLVPFGASHALGSLYVSLAHLLLLTGRYLEMLDATARAGAIAAQIGDAALLAEAEERRGVALLVLNRPEEGQRVIEAAIPLIESSMPEVESNGKLDVLRSALHNAGCAAAYLGQIDRQAHFAERALRVAERAGNPGQIAFVLGNLAHALLVVGEWDRARSHLDRAVRMARESGRSVNLSFPLTMRGLLALQEGDLGMAEEMLEESLRVATETDNRQGREEAERAMAELYVRTGGATQALALLERQASEEDADVTRFPILARTLLETGDLRRAKEIAARGVARAREEEPLSLPDALRSYGTVLARIGQVDEAGAVFEEALNAVRSLPYPYTEAEILLEMGALMSRRGDVAGGRCRLEEARRIFQRLGARCDVERAERALALLAPAY